MHILRDFGKGILYFFEVPAYIIAIAVCSVIGLFIFAFNSIIYIVKFVTGRKLGTLTSEDKKGKEIVKRKAEMRQGTAPSVTRAEIIEPTPAPAPAPTPTYQAPPEQHIEQAPPIQQAQEIDYEEPIISRIEEQPVSNPEPTPQVQNEPEPEVPEEEPEEYNPRTSEF